MKEKTKNAIKNTNIKQILTLILFVIIIFYRNLFNK